MEITVDNVKPGGKKHKPTPKPVHMDSRAVEQQYYKDLNGVLHKIDKTEKHIKSSWLDNKFVNKKVSKDTIITIESRLARYQIEHDPRREK